MLVLVNQCASRLDCLLHYTPRIEIFLVKLNPTAENARDLQEIVYQDDQVPSLASNYGPGFRLKRRFVFLKIQNLNRVRNGRKRIAKLMGKHCQKLVFASVQVR